MRSLTFGKSLKAVLAVVTAVVGLASAQPAAAQPYYYQPAPDYYHNDTASGTFLGGAIGAITGAAVAGRKASRGRGSHWRRRRRRHRQPARPIQRRDRRTARSKRSDGRWPNESTSRRDGGHRYDLVQMTRAGISEDVIISTMRSRGTRIDLSPQSLIALRQQGVSDRVVMAAQQMSAGSGYAPGAPAYGPTVVSEIPPPPAVIVAPAYRPYYYYYPRPYYYGHYHHSPSPAHGGPRRVLAALKRIRPTTARRSPPWR